MLQPLIGVYVRKHAAVYALTIHVHLPLCSSYKCLLCCCLLLHMWAGNCPGLPLKYLPCGSPVENIIYVYPQFASKVEIGIWTTDASYVHTYTHGMLSTSTNVRLAQTLPIMCTWSLTRLICIILWRLTQQFAFKIHPRWFCIFKKTLYLFIWSDHCWRDDVSGEWIRWTQDVWMVSVWWSRCRC